MNSAHIDSYRLVRNHGSSHSTYLAQPEDGGELSILKVFPGELLDAEGWGEVCGHFRRNHGPGDSVCWITEVGLVDGHVYAVAPYLAGETMAQLIKAANLRRESTREPAHHRAMAAVLAGLIDGLLQRGTDDFSHPVFDRDMVTPSELFVLRDGSTRVLDAGWAWLRARTTGSPWSSLERNLAYIAPARRAGPRPGDAGRSWSLAVMLWELLTGYRLFRRNTLESTLHAVAGCDVPDPRLVNPTVPKALANLCLRALSEPGALSLVLLRDELVAWLGGSRADEPALVAAWVAKMFPDDAPVVIVRETTEEDDGSRDSGEWSAVEESTTCIAVPPRSHEFEPIQLSWLEGEALPRMESPPRGVSVRPTPESQGSAPRGPEHHRFQQLAAGAILLSLLGLGMLEDGGRRTSERQEKSSLASMASPLPPRQRAEEHSFAPTDPSGPSELGALTLEEIPLRIDEAPSAPVPRRAHAAREKSEKSEKSSREATSTTGDLLVRAPAGTVVGSEGARLGEGTFRLRLPVGRHVLRAESPSGVVTYTQVEVRAGALGVVEVR